jgi:hypothetical protein
VKNYGWIISELQNRDVEIIFLSNCSRDIFELTMALRQPLVMADIVLEKKLTEIDILFFKSLEMVRNFAIYFTG